MWEKIRTFSWVRHWRVPITVPQNIYKLGSLKLNFSKQEPWMACVCASASCTCSLTACSCFLFMSLMCLATLCMVSMASCTTSWLSVSFSMWLAISCSNNTHRPAQSQRRLCTRSRVYGLTWLHSQNTRVFTAFIRTQKNKQTKKNATVLMPVYKTWTCTLSGICLNIWLLQQSRGGSQVVPAHTFTPTYSR